MRARTSPRERGPYRHPNIGGKAMSKPGYRELCSLSLAAGLLFLPAMSAVAGGRSAAVAERDFQLDEAQMEEALSVEGFHLRLEGLLPAEAPGPDAEEPLMAANEPVPPLASGGLVWTGSGDLSELAQVAAQQTPDPEVAPVKEKKGGWLKKHWWVPVLAAVAVGVAIGGGGDDDVGGEDD
jgi:hypothetical protein